MPMEIERKFLVDVLPTADVLGPGQRIRQGYLAEEDDIEVRVRLLDDESVLTVKAGVGRSRLEVERAIESVEAEALWVFTEGRRIEKTRHRVDLGAVVAEVDVYEGALAGLHVAEVEFSSDAAADGFVPPPWFGRELTGEPGWGNASLARRGARPR